MCLAVRYYRTAQSKLITPAGTGRSPQFPAVGRALAGMLANCVSWFAHSLTNRADRDRISGTKRPYFWRPGVYMAGTVVNLLLLGFLFLAAVVCIVAPLGALGVMFWHWHKELDQIGRLKQARSTQIR